MRGRPALAAWFAFAVLAAASPASEAQEPALKGKFLVADPSMPDPRFAGTVIFVLEHNKEGALGVVVNRVGTRRPLGEVLRAVGIAAPAAGDGREIELFWGGPVALEKALVLHSDEFKLAATAPVVPGIALSPVKDVLDAVAKGRGPAAMLLAVGYAGWGAGQLERELESKSWAVVTAGADFLFGADHAGKWERAWKMRTQDL